MCIAKNIVNNMIELIDQIDIEFKNVNENNSKFDLMEQDILHKIENYNFNACEGFYLAKSLQEIRKQRRKNKEEYQTIQSLKSFIGKHKQWKVELDTVLKNIKSVEDKMGKDYKPRVLKEENILLNQTQNNNPNNLNKLRKVNQTNIKFRSRPQYEKVTELLKQISTN